MSLHIKYVHRKLVITDIIRMISIIIKTCFHKSDFVMLGTSKNDIAITKMILKLEKVSKLSHQIGISTYLVVTYYLTRFLWIIVNLQYVSTSMYLQVIASKYFSLCLSVKKLSKQSVNAKMKHYTLNFTTKIPICIFTENWSSCTSSS